MEKDKKVSFFDKHIYKGDKRFFLSNFTLTLGIICVLGGLSQQSNLLSAGIYMVLGSLAYKSAKKRKLGITRPSKVKFIFELITIAIIIILVLISNTEFLYNDPFVSLVIPIWAVIAYITVYFKSKDIVKTTMVIMLLLMPYVSNASFNDNLYYGLQNNNGVKEMQEFLTDQGVYSGPITGNFYSLTLKAVKDFQKKKKISPTSGFFGPLTRQKANEILVANIEPSNQQSIQETGSIPPITEPAKTTNDVVKSLQDQIALLLQQVQAMQAQQITLNQIQQNTQQTAQNTQQIAQNTTPVCTPNWNCNNWTACSNSSQTRTCSDTNNCGVLTNKPIENQSCTPICISNWQCSEWSTCSNSSQSRTCSDINNCGTATNKPSIIQACIMPELIDLNQGLISYWNFDEGSGATVADTSNNYIGNINGQPSWTLGRSGNALNFDGVANFVDMGDISNLDGFTNLTISLWIKTNSDGASFLVNKYENLINSGYYLGINSSNKITFRTDKSNSSNIVNSTNVVNDGNWHNIIAVFQGGVGSKIYIDGINQGTKEFVLNSMGISPSRSFKIGAYSPDQGFLFKGLIDEVRIYNRVLNQSEIQELAK